MEINNRFLFKSKRIDNGEWVQGFYYVFMGKHYIFEQPFENNNLTHQVDESQTVDKVPVFAGTFTMSTVFLV